MIIRSISFGALVLLLGFGGFWVSLEQREKTGLPMVRSGLARNEVEGETGWLKKPSNYLAYEVSGGVLGMDEESPGNGLVQVTQVPGDVGHWYEVALDELWVATAGESGRLIRVGKQPDLKRLFEVARARTVAGAEQVQLVLYPAGQAERDEGSRRILTRRLLIQGEGNEGGEDDLQALGVASFQRSVSVPGMLVAEVDEDPGGILEVLRRVREAGILGWVQPLLARAVEKKGGMDDPILSQQWHLKNRGQSGGRRGMDANVMPVWDRYRGAGLRIGVLDDGIDFSHPDLAAAAADSGHFDWVDSDEDPSPRGAADDHGTAVAGIAGARGFNGVGGAGVAPEVTLVGLRLGLNALSDFEEGEAFLHGNHSLWVKNSSWGPLDLPDLLGEMGVLASSSLAFAAQHGRDGRGTVFTWAAGNGRARGDQANKDAYANSRYTIAVGAVTNRGHLARYSETGANLVVCAPSSGGKGGVVTTDRQGNRGYNYASAPKELTDRDYTRRFGGTSAAAPVVAGVVTLMLEAKPELGWRDVQEILLRSSSKLLPKSKGWVEREGGLPMMPKIKHHHGFGGGKIDAAAAVALAESWNNLPDEMMVESSFFNESEKLISDKGVPELVAFDFHGGSPMRVEFVELELDLPHSRRGDLLIKVRSPSGVESVMAAPSRGDRGYDAATGYLGQGYEGWTFMSVRHWGESSEGVWQLLIRDMRRGDQGYLRSAKLRLFGTSTDAGMMADEGPANRRSTVHAADSNSGMGPIARDH